MFLQRYLLILSKVSAKWLPTSMMAASPKLKLFTTRLKSLLTKAGYNADLYSGHSFRRGGATFLHSVGGTSLMVQASGDWSSTCFTRYLHLSFGERLRSQVLIANAISASQ